MDLVKIKQLGLAAYAMMSGAKLIKVENREFVFESELTESEWRIRYNNSCCMQHDSIVCELRKHLKASL